MRSKKGFTLIELLAVIVILAVIALIATPIIMNVINDSKKGAAKDAMYGYVKAVELAGAGKITATTDAPSGNYTTKDGNIYSGTTKVMDVSFKGTKPADNGTITLSHGNVTQAQLTFDGIDVTYDGKKAESEARYRAGDIIYYNPETNKKCSSSEVNTAVLAKTGCLKWNVITMDDAANKTSINIMLDHNTTKHVAWNSTGASTEMKEVATAIADDIATWHTSIKSTVKLISGQEIADIVADTSWTGDFSNLLLKSQPWLYQNLSGNNTSAQPIGYWTSTSCGSDCIWCLQNGGRLIRDNVLNTGLCGVRPVITISKSVIA